MIALVANGAIFDYKYTARRLRAFAYVVAVDGGLNHCYAMGIQPNLIVGDLDSAAPDVLSHYSMVEQRRFPSDKNETDLELAIAQVMDDEKQLVVFGALNQRTDHSLGNLHLLRRYPGRIVLESEFERVFAVRGQVELACRLGQTISLIPLGGPVRGVTSKGLRWELNHSTFDMNFFSISNEAVAERVEVRIEEGDLICVMQH